jgi:hypothetical protein
MKKKHKSHARRGRAKPARRSPLPLPVETRGEEGTPKGPVPGEEIR